MVEQTLMNLCVNARDAMPEGGTLTIATHGVSYTDDLPEMDLHWAKAGRYVLLTVQDSGCGMDDEILEHIFEPFFTTKELGSGTGLGLATVYGIVKQHSGTIHVESEPGKGTTFSLYWPVSEQDAEITEVDVADSRTIRGTERILLVEDDEAVRELARTVLERAGFAITTAHNGAEAVATIQKNGDAFDLAILDVVMPRMGGREAYERMREMRPDLRVLFASGYSAGGVHTNFVLDSSLNLLQKPFSPRALLQAVRRTLDRPGLNP
jgi:CheY-like chemotaxis protein